MPEEGVILLVSGPAGIGKTTVCKSLLEEFSPRLQRIVTATTRPPREGENDGVDYHFLSMEEFEERIKSKDFYEHALVHGRRYGTLKNDIREKLESGAHLLLNVDVQGADAFRSAADEDDFLKGKLHTVFLMPESLENLRRRLLGRGTDSDQEIDRRMKTAGEEISRSSEYDHCLLSSTKDQDYERLKRLYLQFSAKADTN